MLDRKLLAATRVLFQIAFSIVRSSVQVEWGLKYSNTDEIRKRDRVEAAFIYVSRTRMDTATTYSEYVS
jgi:hypothetical protein